MKTREKEIVISKTLKGLHEDGTDHYEAFLFKGFTERTTPYSGNFYFETHTNRPFFVSGKADDTSQGVVENVNVPFAREGQWFLNPNVTVDGKNAIDDVGGLLSCAVRRYPYLISSGSESSLPQPPPPAPGCTTRRSGA